MATAKMNEIRPYLEAEIEEKKWELKEVLAAPGNGESILIPQGVTSVAVALKGSSSGDGKVQFTLAPLVDVVAATAVWEDWVKGAIGVDGQHSSEYPPAFTAIRQVNTAGTTTLYVKAA